MLISKEVDVLVLQKKNSPIIIYTIFQSIPSNSSHNGTVCTRNQDIPAI